MTCIVVKDGVLAADRKQVGPHLCSVNKTWTAPDGSIFADAGDATWGAMFKEWYLQGQKPERREALAKLMSETEGDVLALQVKPDRSLVLWSVPFIPLPLMNSTYGVGSGSPYALGAVSAGASLEEAIRIASQWDENTGTDCDVLAIPEKPPRKRRG